MTTFIEKVLSKPAEYKRPVRAATTAALPANTRSGIYLTASANGALAAQDGVNVDVSDRVLVWQEADGIKHGIYEVLSLGGASEPWVLKRPSDATGIGAFERGSIVPITDGTLYGGRSASLVMDAPVVGTTPLTFEIASGGGSSPVTQIKAAVQYATAAALPSHTRNVNVLTASANGALAVDSTTVQVGWRILDKNESASGHLEHGIYVVTQVGSAGTPWILTRASDWDSDDELAHLALVVVALGSQSGQWYLATPGPYIVNTTALKFEKVPSDGAINLLAFGAVADDTLDDRGIGPRMTGHPTLQFVAATSKIIRSAGPNGEAAGSWIEDGFTTAHKAYSRYATNAANNVSLATIAAVTATDLTLSGVSLVDETRSIADGGIYFADVSCSLGQGNAVATDNFAARQKAMSVAVAAGRDLYCPAGYYYFNLANPDTTLRDVTVSGHLRIIGDGDRTVWRFGPDLKADCNGMRRAFEPDANAELILKELRIIGPEQLEHHNTATKTTAAVLAGLWTDGVQGRLILDDATVQRWGWGVNAKNTLVETYDSRIYAAVVAIAVGESGYSNAGLFVRGGEAHSNRGFAPCTDQTAFAAADPLNEGTATYYVRSGVAVDIDGHKWGECAQSLIWQTGTDATPYYRVTNSVFDSWNAAEIVLNCQGCEAQLANNTFRLRRGNSTNTFLLQGNKGGSIVNCTFDGDRAFDFVEGAGSGDWKIINARFRGTVRTAISRQLNSDTGTHNLEFIDCTDELSGPPTDACYHQDKAGVRNEFSRCKHKTPLRVSATFGVVFANATRTLTRTSGTGFRTAGLKSGQSLTVSGTVSNNWTGTISTCTEDVIVIAAGPAIADETDASCTLETSAIDIIKQTAGTLRLDNTRCFNSRTILVEVLPTVQATTTELYGTSIDVGISGGLPIKLVRNATYSATSKLKVRDCNFVSGAEGTLSAGTRADDFDSDVQFRRSRGADKASGATVVVSLAADTYVVTGVGAVSTINLISSAMMPLLTGTLKLIARGAALSGNPNLTFADLGGGSGTIVRAAGEWTTTDAFAVGCYVTTSGAANAANNRTSLKVTAIGTTTNPNDTLTVTTGATAFVAEGPSANIMVTAGFYLNTGGNVYLIGERPVSYGECVELTYNPTPRGAGATPLDKWVVTG